jgi:hypothetical protein
LSRPILIVVLAALLVGCSGRGSLIVESDPPGAAIWLDSDSTGLATPTLLVDLPARHHQIRLSNPGMEWLASIDVRNGDTGAIQALLPTTIWSWGEPGMRFYSLPAVSAGHDCWVVGCSTDYAGSRLLAFDSTGSLRWQAPLGKGACPSPVIDEYGTVIVVAPKSLLAYAPGGALRWNCPAPGSVRPAVALGADNTVYAATADSLVAILAGARRWSLPMGGRVVTRPVVGASGTIYVQTRTELVAVDPDGTVCWRHVLDAYAYAGYLAIDGSDNIYCRTSASLLCVRPDGTLRWRFACRYEEPIPGPVVSRSGAIFTKLGRWFCAVDSTSRFLWSSAEPLFSCHAAPALADDGSILVSTSGWYANDNYAVGSLSCLYPDGSPHWRRTTSPSPAPWRAPVLVGERLYVTTDESLFCIRLGATAATGPWPMFQHDARHTGRVGAR